MSSPKWERPHAGFPAVPCWESQAQSSLLPPQHCKSPPPSCPIPSASIQGPQPKLLAPLCPAHLGWPGTGSPEDSVLGAVGCRRGHPGASSRCVRSFKEGVGWLEAANRLGMTPEYADGRPGVCPPSAPTLLSCLPGLQTRHQCWVCSVRQPPASLVAEQGDARWAMPAWLCHPRGCAVAAEGLVTAGAHEEAISGPESCDQPPPRTPAGLSHRLAAP